MMPERVGVYPGTFDPLTNGHLDIIGRAARLFDRLVVAVAVNQPKAPILPLAERLDLARIETAALAQRTGLVIEVRPLTGLLIAFARACGATAIVRGLRGMSDFDAEAAMAGTNHRLAPDIETLFLIAAAPHQCIASSLVRQIAMLGGDIAGFVPPATLARVLDRLRAE